MTAVNESKSDVKPSMKCNQLVLPGLRLGSCWDDSTFRSSCKSALHGQEWAVAASTRLRCRSGRKKSPDFWELIYRATAQVTEWADGKNSKYEQGGNLHRQGSILELPKGAQHRAFEQCWGATHPWGKTCSVHPSSHTCIEGWVFNSTGALIKNQKKCKSKNEGFIRISHF